MSDMLPNNPKRNLWEQLKNLAPVVTAFLGVISGALIADKTYISDTRLQNQSYILELRQEAYTNFFESQAKLRESERLEDEGHTEEAFQLRNEYNLAVKTALFQIIQYSSKDVNEALAENFLTRFNYGPCVGDWQQWKNEARIYQSMRQEVFKDDTAQAIDDNTILILLFKCTLP